MRGMTTAVLLSGLALLLGGARGEAAEASLDWSAWRHIPVLHHGRIMPLDTFARQAVDIICDRTNPKLGLKGAVPADELNSAEYEAALKLFPAGPNDKPAAGAPRRFEAVELLVSWLAEPEKWEDVPFILAEHDELREKYLGVPVTNEKGEHLRYVSPRQVEEAAALHEGLAAMRDRRRQAMLKEEEFVPTNLDKRMTELQEAYSLFRSLTFDPARQITLPRQQALGITSRFLEKFQNMVQTWSSLSDSLGTLPMLGESDELTAGKQSLQSVFQLVEQPDATAAQIEPHLEKFLVSAKSLAKTLGRLRKNLLDKPEGDQLAKLDARQLDQFRSLFREFDAEAAQLVKQAAEMRIALYDNGDCIHVVPALDPYALEKDRPREDDAHPWLSLQAVLYGSKDFLHDYPEDKVTAARNSFRRAVQAYLASQSKPTAKAADEFLGASLAFSRSLRELAEAVEPQREKLPIEARDDELIAHTAYPAPEALDVEVRYNHVEPFKWSWIISLGAVCSLALAFGIIRKPMFWLGVSLLFAGLGWTAYGFAMRISITHWAPVTNMYETVVFVPFFVSMLGAWFTLLPLTWPGLKNAWRFSAIPGTWEQNPLTLEQKQLFDGSTWTVGGYLMLLPRAALMAGLFYALARAPYAAGGRTVINLLPNIDAGQSLPDGNDLMTWFVGLCVLIPSIWFLPRVALSCVLGLAFVPLSLRGRFGQLVEQVYPRWPFVLSATFAAFLGAFTAWWSPVLNENIEPLQPVLRDNFWLLIHVLTIVSSYGAGALAWGLGNISLVYYLFGKYRDPVVHTPAAAGFGPASDDVDVTHQGRRPPEACHALAGYTYKAVQVAVMLLITGTILGGLWADVSWGRFWGWDPKEVWALISGLVYLAILHGRYAGLFGNFGLAIGSVLGASAIVFSWYGVNFVLGAGLHSYGFGAGGQAEVGAAVLLNWAFALAATIRYLSETTKSVPATKEEMEPAETR
ncbi:MAG TPA: cytochrome c biogenesis protein CcsA [Pirellulales bacterium]|nr:cytochrome c biogenesis protein CcsA [Pirellulales bacterium]